MRVLINGVLQNPVADAAGNAVGEAFVFGLKSFISWFIHHGFPICAELALVWAMICFLIAIAGTGKWLERGAKTLLASIMFACAGWFV